MVDSLPTCQHLCMAGVRTWQHQQDFMIVLGTALRMGTDGHYCYAELVHFYTSPSQDVRSYLSEQDSVVAWG